MPGGDYEAASRDQWGAAAESWKRAVQEPDTGPGKSAADWMLEAVALRPGDRVLELACGAGRVGLRAAEQVRPGGRVLCSDFAAPMVEAVRTQASRLGLENLEARVMNAEDLDLGSDDRFDVVLCRHGYMLMADPAKALEESHRALEPGGRLALAVWGPAPKNPWLSVVFDAVMSHLGAPPPAPGTPGPFALADRARLEELLAGAGFGEAEVAELSTRQDYESLEAWWERLHEISGPLATLLESLPDADAEAIRTKALAAADDHVEGRGASFPACVTVARAQRPA